MKSLAHPLLADENIHPEVVRALREQGKAVRTVIDEGLEGRDDAEVLSHAHQRGSVVVTQDTDFGNLSIRLGKPFVGIVYLRPGHIDPSRVLESRPSRPFLSKPSPRSWWWRNNGGRRSGSG